MDLVIADAIEGNGGVTDGVYHTGSFMLDQKGYGRIKVIFPTYMVKKILMYVFGCTFGCYMIMDE